MTQEDGPFPHGCVLVDDYFSSPDQHRDVATISCHPLLLSSHELHALGSTLLSITLCGQCHGKTIYGNPLYLQIDQEDLRRG